MTLSKEHLYMVSDCDSAFAVWNTLTSLALQTTIYVEEESSGDESDQPYYIVQGKDSLEVNSDTHLDDCTSSSSNDYVDADALNEELSIVCENLLEKYQLLKKKTFKIKEENKDLVSKLNMALQERDEISNACRQSAKLRVCLLVVISRNS